MHFRVFEAEKATNGALADSFVVSFHAILRGGGAVSFRRSAVPFGRRRMPKAVVERRGPIRQLRGLVVTPRGAAVRGGRTVVRLVCSAHCQLGVRLGGRFTRLKVAQQFAQLLEPVRGAIAR
jgi:hypothetical protein